MTVRLNDGRAKFCLVRDSATGNADEHGLNRQPGMEMVLVVRRHVPAAPTPSFVGRTIHGVGDPQSDN